MDLSRRRATASAMVLVAVLGVAGCGSDDPEPGPAAGPGASTATTSASSTAAGGPAGEGSASTAPARAGSGGAGACPGDGTVPPEGATEVTEVSADVDGDGSDDRVLAYREAGGPGRMAVELAAGGTSDVDAGGPADGPAPLSLLGGAHLGGTGETVLAVTGSGASVVVVGLFQLVECAISHVAYPGGQPAQLPVGGTVTHGDGIRCASGPDGAGLVRLTATSSDGESFTTTHTRYRVDGNTLVEVGSASGELDRGSAGPELDRYYTIDCPTLDHGPAG